MKGGDKSKFNIEKYIYFPIGFFTIGLLGVYVSQWFLVPLIVFFFLMTYRLSSVECNKCNHKNRIKQLTGIMPEKCEKCGEKLWK